MYPSLSNFFNDIFENDRSLWEMKEIYINNISFTQTYIEDISVLLTMFKIFWSRTTCV